MISNAPSANEQLENWGHSRVLLCKTHREGNPVWGLTHLPEEGAVAMDRQWVSLKMDNTRSSCRWRFGLVSCAASSSCHSFTQATSLDSWFCVPLWILWVRSVCCKDRELSLLDKRLSHFLTPLYPIPKNNQTFWVLQLNVTRGCAGPNSVAHPPTAQFPSWPAAGHVPAGQYSQEHMDSTAGNSDG